MAKRSAGLLMFRQAPSGLEVLLVHPGGPFWAKKDKGAWTLPKGEFLDGEDALAAARREFTEETGLTANEPFHELGTIRQTGGKLVTAWAFAGDCDPLTLRSNTCQIEWPPRSGRHIEIPEVDRAAWYSIAEAEAALIPAQLPFLTALQSALANNT